MCRLVDHKMLFIEGRAFATEAALVQKAIQQGWKIQAEFERNSAGSWAPTLDKLELRFFSNTVSPQTQTLQFYILLPNEFVEHGQGGKTYRLWRFRPGQRVLVHIPVDKFQDVFVVPAEAVVREGPEAYIFRERRNSNADFWERVPVQILHEDNRVAVLAFDEKLAQAHRYAPTGAVQLNWLLRSSRATAGDDE